MAPSITELSKYLSNIDRNQVALELTWQETEEIDRVLPPKGHDLPWNGLSCLAVVSYVLKFCFTSENDDIIIIDVIRVLNDLATQYLELSDPQGPQPLQMERKISGIFFNSFMPKVQRFFIAPKMQQLTNEYLAGFINFLLQILNSEADHIRNEKDYGVNFYFTFDGEERSLQKELTYLLTILGDVPFQCTGLDEVKNLLEEFELFANEVERFIYCRVFASRPVNVRRFYVGICVLLDKVDILKAKIVKYCIEFSKHSSFVTHWTSTVDSHFIVDSLLEDLKNLINDQVDLRDNMKDQIRTLHNVLISARSFMKDIKVTQDKETEEAKEYLVQIRDLAYEAEYLINSFVVGNVPIWYLTLRLPNVIQNFVLIGTSFVTIKKKVLKVSKDCTIEVSSQNIEISNATVDDIVVGFDDETRLVLDELTGGSKDLQTISIFGMPGLGKTTLAKKLYDNGSIIGRFDMRAWCIVSQTYNKKKLLIDLLMCSAGQPNRDKLSNMEDETLSIMIHKSLKKRRYLIVMDDVWNSNVWDDLSRFFQMIKTEAE